MLRIAGRFGPESLAELSGIRIQLSSDAFVPYVNAIQRTFGNQVDYATIVKEYAQEPADRGRYSPPKVFRTTKNDVIGYPETHLISTSYVERSNLSIRMHCRRLTRLTNAFSKKLDNFKAAMDVYFCFYNFVRFHRTLRMTPRCKRAWRAVLSQFTIWLKWPHDRH